MYIQVENCKKITPYSKRNYNNKVRIYNLGVYFSFDFEQRYSKKAIIF